MPRTTPRRRRGNVSVNARLVGNPAPHFEGEAVIDQEFETISLDQYKGKKYVVLFFYPLDFTFVCPTEITAFSAVSYTHLTLPTKA